jgi:hypothetical protein
MTAWKEAFIHQKELLANDIIQVTSQTGYFFKNVLTHEDIREMGFDDPHAVIAESARYSVILHHPTLLRDGIPIPE